MKHVQSKLLALLAILMTTMAFTGTALADNYTACIRNIGNVKAEVIWIVVRDAESNILAKESFDPPLNIQPGARVVVEIPKAAGAALHDDYLVMLAGELECSPSSVEDCAGEVTCPGDVELFVNDIECPQCAEIIPTVSEWGLIVLMLLLLTAGTIVIRRAMVQPQPAAA